jgi:hypothetical protein
MLRGQALYWLKAELAAWAKRLDGGDPMLREQAAQTLQHWKSDVDLTGIRNPEALTKLSDAKRKQWQALWASVDAMLSKARGGRPSVDGSPSPGSFRPRGGQLSPRNYPLGSATARV